MADLVLVLADVTALAIAWTIALMTSSPAASPLATISGVIAAVAATCGSAALQGLYATNSCTVPRERVTRLGRSLAFGTLCVWVAQATSGPGASVSLLLLGAGLSVIGLAIGRSSFEHWLAAQRRQGQFLRPALIVGDNDDARSLIELFRQQPELGLDVVGYVGKSPNGRAASLTAPCLGDMAATMDVVSTYTPTCVVVIATALTPAAMTQVLSALLTSGVHVHLATGLRGVVHQRVRPYPLSYEPLFHVEPCASPRDRRHSLAIKRGIDVALSTLGIVVTFPLLALAAIAIKLDDRGPILYRQERIGRFGRPFIFYKLRTMSPGAESRLQEICDRNERIDGPLFKDDHDPRRTRIGRILEATSIDELAQLWNVLRGDMSLVGPRPALPHEVAQFDEELLTRHSVRPGITGLWQIEGRDNPNFQPYRRLDLVYVENLSLWLDVIIMYKTLQGVVVRAVQKLITLRNRPERAAEPASTANAGVLLPVSREQAASVAGSAEGFD